MRELNGNSTYPWTVSVRGDGDWIVWNMLSGEEITAWDGCKAAHELADKLSSAA